MSKAFDDYEDYQQNFANFDQNLVHIHKVQTRGRKCRTIIRGIGQEFDLKKVVKFCKRNFKCHGHIQEQGKEGKDKDYKLMKKQNQDQGPKKQQLVFSGDQRAEAKQFLVYMGITMEENIRTHGS